MTAMAPDAIDLNAATPEQLAKLGLDEATVKKVVDSRPFTQPGRSQTQRGDPGRHPREAQGQSDGQASR